MFKIKVDEAGKLGRGVFSSRVFLKGDVVEKCPIILLTNKEIASIQKTKLSKYHFQINQKYYCLALGYGSLYNHSYKPNCDYTLDYKKKLLTIMANRKIKTGEQLFINYGPYYW